MSIQSKTLIMMGERVTVIFYFLSCCTRPLILSHVLQNLLWIWSWELYHRVRRRDCSFWRGVSRLRNLNIWIMCGHSTAIRSGVQLLLLYASGRMEGTKAATTTIECTENDGGCQPLISGAVGKLVIQRRYCMPTHTFIESCTGASLLFVSNKLA